MKSLRQDSAVVYQERPVMRGALVCSLDLCILHLQHLDQIRLTTKYLVWTSAGNNGELDGHMRNIATDTWRLSRDFE